MSVAPSRPAPVEGSRSRPHTASARVRSVDAYRGFIMFLMMAEVLQLCAVSQAVPDSGFWRFLCHQQTHALWTGCSLHDLIAPGFYFLVGLTLPFSLGSRRARGESFVQMGAHALGRASLLVLLGMLVQYVRWRSPWSFNDTLTQIGLSYIFAFLIALGTRRQWVLALAGILTAYWLAFAFYPLPRADFDYAGVGLSPSWLAEFPLQGFAAHWQKNSNLAWAFDAWFLNLFPRATSFTHSPLGLATLNFIPTVATMLLGLLAGDLLRAERSPWNKVHCFLLAGVIGLLSGSLLSMAGICPIVKAIWTPSWVLFSGGWCFLFLAAWSWLVEIARQRQLAFPFVVIGANSILAYLGINLYMSFAYGRVLKITGPAIFRICGDAYEPLVYGTCVLGAFWLGLFLLYRSKLFVRI
jgi:heparan-alpha-glucosaminide N-acetyltransferase